MDVNLIPWIGVGASLLAILFALYLTSWLMGRPAGTEKMQSISKAVQEGAMAYLARQYKTIAVVGVIVAVALFLALDWQTAFAFVVGAFFSGLCGFIGMSVSTRSNARVAEAAKQGLSYGLNVSFKAGTVTGMMCVGLALLGLSGVFIAFYDPNNVSQAVHALVGLGFGGSLIALFARIGGGIFTKSADVGADLVGKVEAGIPEDDPRNPATIADNVGDNVGDCAGMAADLFETYAVTAVGAMLLGYLIFGGALEYILYPVALGAVAIVASIIGVFFVRLGGSTNIMSALYKGVWVSAILALIGFYPITAWMLGDVTMFFAAIVGVVATVLIMYITDYYTSKNYRPVRSIAHASQSGHGTNIITGLSVGMESAIPPTLMIVAGILAAYYVGGGGGEGVYAIGIASMAMLSMCGMIVALDSYGPVTDNAGGIAEMADLPPEVRNVTDALDAVGNTTKAVTKGYAIGSAALAAIVLFADYVNALKKASAGAGAAAEYVFKLGDPLVLAGLFIGGAVVFMFSSLANGAVGRAAFSVVEEVRRQFREIPGIMEGTAKPEYGRCVDIVTKRALKEMVVPGLIPVVTVLLVGFILGPLALGGVLIGVIVVGIYMACFQNNAGGAWDNAKKWIEEGMYGGKGSEAHKAAVTGDTVGDPLKDTAGPAVNPVIKVVNVVALLMVPLIFHIVR
ncbi:V-type H(+)-translocating pyrophosphatase [Candidatus Desulforudis audaxviator MP104C]|uniref:K(+)-insensitive pyrophosphate-energized proton pump n=1 Tax=Desulforudis audaxviator (strain MP104C) TaxID=477974 RepID=B1I0V1_DESAP|nr:sodium-translocating pyrophosphatase [Candidatus Desulforudis audaxviator]ACA58869.1 V-type H(+)-translocating pyrophosphatase [Candidatus Desulforudis audaxviator MP104C]